MFAEVTATGGGKGEGCGVADSEHRGGQGLGQHLCGSEVVAFQWARVSMSMLLRVAAPSGHIAQGHRS